ncbi:MAG: isocitrate/isopropylmalate family dehydrogenase [Gaiella sp.]|nr:isocitrate/isopropylmalate family dehydrogenase [Gaiella sp.]
MSEAWATRVDRHADRHPGVEVQHVTLTVALRALAAGSTGVLAAEGVLGDAVAEAPRLGGRRRLVASGHLSPTGPSLFGPAQGTASELAGHGVADPSAMLLATALLLSEGLGRTAAGEALEESLTAALRASRRPSELAGPGVAATTREFVDAVLALLRSARRDTEFALGVGP